MSGWRLVDELLKEDFDFTADEILVTDPDKLHFPDTPEEAHERVAQAAEVRPARAQGRQDGRTRRTIPSETRLTRRYHSFAKRMHQTDSNELLEMFLTAVTSGFDPHSTYMAPDRVEEFRHRDEPEAGGHRRPAAR